MRLQNCRTFFLVFVMQLFAETVIFGQVKAPQITPLSPNAAALWKYTELPVNMYTGIPSISIPIYEIKSGNMSVPISLSYHAGGIRYADQASWVGLGWNLNSGGAISRNIKGKADESGILHPDNQYTPNASTCDYWYFQNVLNKSIDVEPDEFSFNIPGKNGRFVFNPLTKQPVMIPYDPIKFSYTHVPINNAGSLSNLQLLDENGTAYKFGPTENTSGGLGAYAEENYPSSWLLSEMKSADLSHTIAFNYVAGESSVQKLSNAQSISITDDSYPMEPGGGSGGSCGQRVQPSIGSIVTTGLNYLTTAQNISEIIFENGKVQFVQSGTYRTDIFNSQRSLEYINVYAKDGAAYKLIKTVKFIYSYFKRRQNNVEQDWKLKLDKVQILSSTGTVSDEYNFAYNTNVFSGDNGDYAIDYWGYYNGMLTNTNLIPQQTIDYIQNPYVNGTQQLPIGGGNRNVNPDFMTEGVLKKITYPTGGYTEFEFETNKYQADNGVGGIETGNAGGLRVKKIKSTSSATDIPLVKTYKYGLSENGYGFKNFLNRLGYYVTTTEMMGEVFFSSCIQTYYRQRTFNSQGSMQIDGSDGSSVLYPYVKVYDGDEINNNGWVENTFDNGFPDPDDLYLIYGPSTNSFHRQSNHWKRGNLTSAKVFDKSGQKISETINSYTPIHSIYETSGMLLNEAAHFSQTTSGCYSFHNFYPYVFNYYSVKSGALKMTNSIEKRYDQLNPLNVVTNETNYTYDVNYLMPTQVSRTVAAGTGYEKQVLNYSKYPFNYTFTGTASGNDALGIKYLQDKNVFSTPVEQYTIKKQLSGSTVVASNVTNGIVNTFLTGNTSPNKVWSLKTSPLVTEAAFGSGSSLVSNVFTRHAAYEPRLTIKYDALGNIYENNMENNLVKSYLWDYNSVYPVTETINATQDLIAQTSFEAEGTGNWSFAATGVQTESGKQSITGNKYYNLSTGGNISRNLAATGNIFIVSYWSRNGAQNVNGISASTGKSVNISGYIWTYYEHELNNPTLITISGGGIIDELRLYPKTAQMTTYTYAPLIGITSQTDANNRTTYYEYDAFNRLILIRDQDNNILKKICYNYAGQPENCIVPCTNFTPNWQNTATAVRCQQNTCGNTGYQEQEQQDMNSCSPSYNQKRWVVTGYNPSACTVPTCISLTSTNIYGGSSYMASYYNNATGITYNLPVSAATGLQPLGAIPRGTYTLTISSTTGSLNYGIFYSGCLKKSISGTSATFYSVPISLTGCVSIKIDMTPAS
jgi:YD repeat-containing protein